jgi:hypothetical protein
MPMDDSWYGPCNQSGDTREWSDDPAPSPSMSTFLKIFCALRSSPLPHSSVLGAAAGVSLTTMDMATRVRACVVVLCVAYETCALVLCAAVGGTISIDGRTVTSFLLDKWGHQALRRFLFDFVNRMETNPSMRVILHPYDWLA